MDHLSVIAIKYFLFAVISTVLNLLSQYFSFLIYVDFGSLYVAMTIGSFVGLVSKYFLDKKYIFHHAPKNNINVKIFTLYVLTGVITTAIFWGTEIGFDVIFKSEVAKYVGAIIGLGIGYIAKYFLDKKYVFKECVV